MSTGSTGALKEKRALASAHKKPTKKLRVLRGLHSLGGSILKASGYKWSVHQAGEYKFGVWRRKNLRASFKGGANKGAEKKRFVLIPGFGDTPLSWFSVLKVLEPKLWFNFDEILILDFPGFNGFLHNERSVPCMDTMLKKTSELLDGIGPHTVMGHSLGGWIAAHHAGQGKKKPQKLILVAPSGAFDSEQSKAEWSLKFQKVIESQNFDDFRPHVFGREPFWFKYVKEEFEHFITQDANREFMLSVGEHHRVEPLLAGIEADVWFLWGEKDTLVPPTLLQGWLNHLPEHVAREQVFRLVNVGHTPQLESVARTAACLYKILSKN